MRKTATVAALAILFVPALVRAQEPVKAFDQLNTRLRGNATQRPVRGVGHRGVCGRRCSNRNRHRRAHLPQARCLPRAGKFSARQPEARHHPEPQGDCVVHFVLMPHGFTVSGKLPSVVGGVFRAGGRIAYGKGNARVRPPAHFPC